MTTSIDRDQAATPARPPTVRTPALPGGEHGAVAGGLLRRSRVPWLVLAASMLLTLTATALVEVSGRARDQARFTNAVQSTQDRIRSRLDTYGALLLGARGVFAASDSVTRGEFRRYVELLDVRARYPGIQGIGYSRLVTPAERERVVARARASGIPEFRLWPDGARDEVHAILFLEPLDRRNRAAIGYDMFTDPTRRAAMVRARDTGQPAMSGRVTLKQEIDENVQPGFLLYVPVYRRSERPESVEARRAALQGFVYSPFRAGDLFRGIFGTEAQPRVTFRVFDGVDTSAAALLFDSAREMTEEAPEHPRFRTTTRLEIAGRTWTLAFASLPFLDRSGRLAAIGIFTVGTLVSLALFTVTRAEAQARAAAERSEAVRRRFFAAMSHELRTPINAILGYNELLLMGIHGPLPDEQRRGLERSQKAARHLLELVNDVLDLSKLEAGKIDLEISEVDVPALLEDLLTTIRPMAERRGSELELDVSRCSAGIRTDARRVRQILLNLLSNATKFGAGAPVRVRCADAPGGVTIAVEDHGPGIAPADMHRIFEEFVQLPNAHGLGGTGLGLPISRRLAELLGGTLAVQSTPGVGSVFLLTLPAEPPRG